ncbi:MAG: cobalamin-dependent protein [Pseudomonadota bacterium]
MDGEETSSGYDPRAPGGDAVIYDRPPVSFDALENVTRELVSRLSQKLPTSTVRLTDDEALTNEELNEFCDALTSDDPGQFRLMFENFRLGGRTLDTLCLRCIAPAARRLGDRWVTDETGFLEVTLGLTRLHGLQRQLRDDFAIRTRAPVAGMSALFSPVPGDTHVLGVTMAADFFRRAGWIVDLNMKPDADQTVEIAITGGYALIGLSAGCRAVIPDLRALVIRLRKIQPCPKIILGGHLVTLEPDIADELGVDEAFTDVTSAPFVCHTMLTTALEC